MKRKLNKKGFTLVEIIAVIGILALIIILVVPNITKSSEGARQKAYDTKVSEIENAAKLYIQENYGCYVKKAREKNENPYEKCITVKELIPNYIEPDDNEMVLNPKTNESINDKAIKFTIDINTKKITTKYMDDELCSESDPCNE